MFTTETAPGRDSLESWRRCERYEHVTFVADLQVTSGVASGTAQRQCAVLSRSGAGGGRRGRTAFVPHICNQQEARCVSSTSSIEHCATNDSFCRCCGGATQMCVAWSLVRPESFRSHTSVLYGHDLNASPHTHAPPLQACTTRILGLPRRAGTSLSLASSVSVSQPRRWCRSNNSPRALPWQITVSNALLLSLWVSFSSRNLSMRRISCREKRQICVLLQEFTSSRPWCCLANGGIQ